MELSEWIASARSDHSAQLDTKIKIVGVIGKDYPDHGKGDNINCYMRENVFPVSTDEEETCTIRAHFHEDEQTLFLVMNGSDEMANVRKAIEPCVNEEGIDYFNAMAESEEQQMRMLHFLFISCHFVIIFEETSRLELEFMRLLRRVNASRMQLRRKVNRCIALAGLKEVAFNKRTMSQSESEGRMVIPRLLIAFQRNNLKNDMTSAKKRELYEKLEKNLDSQFSDILKSFELVESGGNALCQLNETIPCVHLINPKIVKRDVLAEMFDALMSEIEGRTPASTPRLSSNNSFVMFLDDNLRSEKSEISLEQAIQLMHCLQCVLDGSIEKKEEKKIADYNPMTNFIKRIREENLDEAMRIYLNEATKSGGRADSRSTWRSENDVAPVRVRSKEEHMLRFKEATRYIEFVSASNPSDIISELQARCDKLWQSDMRACESVSMFGHPCVRKAHPTFGDPAVPEVKWTAHDAANTLISTCFCGKKQIVRQEPFSVKEANFDFFENAELKCCRRLWRYHFQVYQEDYEEKDSDLWAGRESNSLRTTKKVTDEEDLVVTMTSESVLEDEGSDEDVRVRTQSSSSTSDDDMYIRPVQRRDETKSERELAVEHANRLQKLEAAGKSNDFILDVPNSLTAGRLPLFPSWCLTSLGDSSNYNHGTGLRNQPNFKIGGEYLMPVVVYLDVDQGTWNRDLNKVRGDTFNRNFIKEKEEIARVKLFVGVEYECTRGHRFFVDHAGEPVIYPKGANVVRESGQRSSMGDLLEADLPIRRPCTCRKLPLKSAQIQKIHIVTPKAPVSVTVDPQVLIPGHDGVYGTGQAPLELHHSKYYILHFPLVYSGPSGTWIPEEYSAERQGTFIGGAIKVFHKPVLPFRW